MNCQEIKKFVERIEAVRVTQDNLMKGMEMLAGEIAQNRADIGDLRGERTYIQLIEEAVSSGRT